jgi:hypothetical protein
MRFSHHADEGSMFILNVTTNPQYMAGKTKKPHLFLGKASGRW